MPTASWARLARGDLVGPNPTDRAKNGTKRSLIVDAKGGILSVTLDGANRHDAKMLAATVADMIVGRPEPEEGPQNLCLDKGYDNPSGETAALGGWVCHAYPADRGGETRCQEEENAQGPEVGRGTCRSVA